MVVCAPDRVDSPILTGQTDTEYLTKDFEGAYSPLGSIFDICRSQAFWTGQVICLPTIWLPDRCSEFETIYGRSVF